MNFINGLFTEQETGSSFTPICPSTGKLTVDSYPQTEPETIAKATQAARTAFDSWRKTSRIKRAEYFDLLAGYIKLETTPLANLICYETGKSYNEAKAEVIEA